MDEWSDVGKTHTVLGITGHYVDNDFNPKHVVLGVESIKGSANGENLAALVEKVIKEFEIDKSKIVTVLRDGAATMAKVCRLIDLDSQHCFAHALQLVIKDSNKLWSSFDTVVDKVKTFIGKVRKSSVLQQVFKDAQMIEDLPQNTLQLGIDVRWSSLYNMLNSFLDNKEAIAKMMKTKKLKLPTLDESEWSMIQNVVEVLEVFCKATDFVQNRTSTLAVAIPVYKLLQMKMSNLLKKKEGKKEDGEDLEETEDDDESEDNEEVILYIKALQDNLEIRFSSLIDKKEYALSTLLDPRFKMLYLKTSAWIDVHEQWLFEEINETENVPPPPKPTCSDIDPADIFAEYEAMNESTPEPEELSTKKQLLSAEYKKYISEPRIDKSKTSAAEYWKINAIRFPILDSLYSKYATAPVTSSEAERLFSIAGIILTNLRNSLSDESLKKLLFLNANLKIFDFDY